MIRVGFVIIVSSEWMGGLNYFKNLIYAISTLDNRQIEPLIFMGKKTETHIKQLFSPYATIIETSMLDRKTLPWLLWKLADKLLHINLLDILLKKNGIDVLSHSNQDHIFSCPTIEWIPDFQHLHLPDMFPPQEIVERSRDFLSMAKTAKVVVLSSNDALHDFEKTLPDYVGKARVLHFVSQSDAGYALLNEKDKLALMQKYGITTPYLYLPNQFWKHKNHQVVFEAVALLAQQGVPVLLVCSGHMQDYRHQDHLHMLQEVIAKNNLHDNIKLLGMVPYKDLFALIRFSEVVINPSLFEGWSSTVEECKGVGKMMLLSDLAVHREQYPEAVFFDRNDAQDLAQKLVHVLEHGAPVINRYNLVEMTKSYAGTYQGIVQEVVA